jgi:nitroreductase
MIKSDSAALALVERDEPALRTAIPAATAAELRRSVRAYTDEPVSDDTLRRLLTLAGRAPSAFNLQPWRFVVVRDPSTKALLSAAAYGQKQVTGAPVVVALYADMEDTLARLGEIVHPGLDDQKRADTIAMLQRNFGGMSPEQRGAWANAQANIALGYLLLLAKSEGLDTSPMLGFEPGKVKQVLGIPEHATVTALVSLGYGAEEGFVSHRHALDAIATFR